MSISDETLMAYADGELDATAAAEIDAAIREDPQLAGRIAQYHRQREQLQAAFDAVLREPVPARLTAAARGVRSIRPRRRWPAPELGAIAASLLAGALLSWGILRQVGDSPMTMAANGLVAGGVLARSLSADLSGDPTGDPTTGPVRVGLSFRDRDGNYCRTFAIEDGEQTAGVACRKAENWQVEVAIRRASDESQSRPYRQASSLLSPEIRRAVEARIAGEPLDAEQEKAARDRAWRD